MHQILTDLDKLHWYHFNRPHARQVGKTFYGCHELLACICLLYKRIYVSVTFTRDWTHDGWHQFYSLIHEYDIHPSQIAYKSDKLDFYANNSRVLVVPEDVLFEKTRGVPSFTVVDMNR